MATKGPVQGTETSDDLFTLTVFPLVLLEMWSPSTEDQSEIVRDDGTPKQVDGEIPEYWWVF